MGRDEVITQKTQKEIEIERLLQYPSAPYYAVVDRGSNERPSGVLLSDEIEFYCKYYKLVDPYKPANIMAASYELRVGLKYSVGGKPCVLKPGEKLTIPRFEVAVIEILETLNMPDFLIGRWNIRTRWAYEGLIWVGGPQVNPGYRGLLMCPLWNLSNKDFEIECGEPIAVMDFQTTTPVTASSNRLPPWNKRTRYVFEDYKPEQLRSGLIEESVNRIKELQAGIRNVEVTSEQTRNRIDHVTALMFTALGVLTTAITLFVTKPSQLSYLWDPTIFWLCSATLILALFAWLKSQSSGKWWWGIHLFVLLLAILSLGLQIYRLHSQTDLLRTEQTLVDQLQQRVDALERSKPASTTK
jgi:deoxycytidine triphosphate deaminase